MYWRTNNIKMDNNELNELNELNNEDFDLDNIYWMKNQRK